MYRNIIIGLLLLGSISSIVLSQDGTTPAVSASSLGKGPGTTVSNVTHLRAAEQSVTRSHPGPGPKSTEAGGQIQHTFSEPVIIVIIFGVMAGIVLVILLFAYGIRKLSQRSQSNVQPELPQNTDEPLSSVETGNPVLPQNTNE